MGLAAAHKDKGWEPFTDAVVAEVNRRHTPAVFMLWVSHAQKKAAQVDTGRHLVLKAPHPSPLSAHNSFFGCRHFSKATEFLKANWQAPMHWPLPPLVGPPGLAPSDSRMRVG